MTIRPLPDFATLLLLSLLAVILSACGEEAIPHNFGQGSPTMSDELIDRALGLQLAYWRYDADAHRQLESRADELSWAERLRLMHLLQWQQLRSEAGQQQLVNLDPFEDAYAPDGPVRERLVELITELSGPDSPYRARPASVWQYRSAEEAPAEADLSGPFQNISATHLGSLEVIRLDSDQQPSHLDFVPFSEMRAIQFDRNAKFRPARLHYNDGRDPEVVLTPYFYLASYLSGHDSDIDGSTTRFILSLDVSPYDGIGLGEQDFTVGSAIFRFSTIRFIEFD